MQNLQVQRHLLSTVTNTTLPAEVKAVDHEVTHILVLLTDDGRIKLPTHVVEK
jgi:hypothetical protein